MPIKCTLLIQLATGTVAPNPSLRRIGGWSESFYFPGTDMAAAIAQVNKTTLSVPLGLCNARGGLLPSSAQIIGQRFQQVTPRGASQSLNRLWDGGSGFDTDIPQMALLTRIPSVDGAHVRPYIIRGIPDALVVDGEFRPTADINLALTNLFRTLGLYSMRVVNRVAAPQQIASIDASGKIIFNAVRPTIPVGGIINLVDIMVAGRTISGPFVVAAIGPESLALTITGWTYGVGLGGQGLQNSVSYLPLDGTKATVGRIIVKKVGRPFVGYRGRAWTRRRRHQAV
jgi:hypothetical protein